MNRKNLIKALTKYELEWLCDNPEHLDGCVDFFANGGFANMTDEQLTKESADNVWLEIEGENK